MNSSFHRGDRSLSFEPVLAFRFGETFDGVTERGARHVAVVFFEIVEKKIFVDLAGLAQHPSHRLAHQVVRMMQQLVGKPESVVGLPGAHQPPCSHHAYALFPQVVGGREAVKNAVIGHRAVSLGIKQPFAYDFGACHVH